MPAAAAVVAAAVAAVAVEVAAAAADMEAPAVAARGSPSWLVPSFRHERQLFRLL